MKQCCSNGLRRWYNCTSSRRRWCEQRPELLNSLASLAPIGAAALLQTSGWRRPCKGPCLRLLRRSKHCCVCYNGATAVLPAAFGRCCHDTTVMLPTEVDDGTDGSRCCCKVMAAMLRAAGDLFSSDVLSGNRREGKKKEERVCTYVTPRAPGDSETKRGTSRARLLFCLPDGPSMHVSSRSVRGALGKTRRCPIRIGNGKNDRVPS
jgi:hypothetical protein